MKKALSIVFSTILLLALLVVPAQAADQVELNLPVTQTVTLEGEGAQAEDAVVNYTFTAVTAGAPMPAGAGEGDYSFQLIGNEEYQIPTITYTSTGKWQYLLTAEGSDVDPESVDITVYVTLQDGKLTITALAYLPSGEKCDLTFEAKVVAEPVPPEPITHTVTFETGEGSDVDDQIVNDGETAEEPEDPTWDGHTFEGWYEDEECTKPYDFSTPVTEDITLYAKWEEEPAPPEPVTHTVTFETGEGSDVDDQIVNDGETATEPQDPTREGYTFGGWYLDEDCTIPYDFSTPVTEDITLYAKWTENEEPVPPAPVTHTVTFETGEGSDVDDQIVNDGETATKPQDPTREGYTFDGWYLDEDCTIPYDFNTPVTEDITLYAKWTKVVPTGEFEAWSLMNLICAILTAAIAGAMMVTAGRNRRRLLGLMPAIASAAIFLMTEHMSLPMQLCDKFTPLMVGLLAVSVMLAYLTNGKTVEERPGDSD